MKSVANRAKSFGWDNILNIIDSHRNTKSLLYDYGQLTTEEVKMHAQNQRTNQPTRDERMQKCYTIFCSNRWMKTSRQWYC